MSKKYVQKTICFNKSRCKGWLASIISSFEKLKGGSGMITSMDFFTNVMNSVISLLLNSCCVMLNIATSV